MKTKPSTEFRLNSTAFLFVVMFAFVLLCSGAIQDVDARTFDSETFGDNYHLMYLSPKTTYFGDVKFNHASGTADVFNRIPSGRNFVNNEFDSDPIWSQVLSGWTLRSDGSFLSGGNVNLNSNSVRTPMEGFVSDTKNTTLFESVLENPNFTSPFKKGQYMLGAKFGQGLNNGLDTGAQYIGVSLVAVCPRIPSFLQSVTQDTLKCTDDRTISHPTDPTKSFNLDIFPFTSIALGSMTMDNSNQGDMDVTRSVPGAVAENTPDTQDSPGIVRKSFSNQSMNVMDTGAFEFGRAAVPTGDTKEVTVRGRTFVRPIVDTVPVYSGAVTPDTEFMFARFNLRNFLRPIMAVRLDETYELSDFFGFYTVNKVFIGENPSTGDSSVVSNQSFFKAGFKNNGIGKWAAYPNVESRNAQFSGTFTQTVDDLPTGSDTDPYFQLRVDSTGDTFRVYLSPSSKYFVMVPGSLQRNAVYVGFRMPTTKLADVDNTPDTIVKDSEISSRMSSQKAINVASAKLGKSHPRNANFDTFASAGSNADTSLGSAIDITPDTGVRTASSTVCINANAADTAGFDTYSAAIFESGNGWVNIEDAGGTIVSKNGAKICFKPPHYSNMTVTASSTSSDGGSDGGTSGSDDSGGGGCVIEQSDAPVTVIESLRTLRDRTLETSLGRLVTELYYGFQK